MSKNSLDRNRARIIVVAAAALVVLWRVTELQQPSEFVQNPDLMRLPLALLGMLFLLCGLPAWWFRPGRWTGIFLLYGLGGGIHWGGSIGSGSANVELTFFLLYLSFTALTDAALLHLALVFPSGRSLARSWKRALYFPAALALILAP